MTSSDKSSDLEALGRKVVGLVFKAIGLIVIVQLAMVFIGVIGVALEFLFGPTPLGRIAMFILLIELKLLGTLFAN